MPLASIGGLPSARTQRGLEAKTVRSSSRGYGEPAVPCGHTQQPAPTAPGLSACGRRTDARRARGGAAKTQPARRVSSRLAVHTYLHLLLRALRSNEDRLLDQLVRLFELGDALTRLSLRRCGGRATTTKKKARPRGRAFARCGACFRSCAGTARRARGRWPGRSPPPSLLLPRSGCC